MLRIAVSGAEARTVSESCVIALAAGEVLSVDLASGGHWYGHGFSHVQPYPLETGSVVNEQFAVNNIQSPIWMCSTGYALLARTTARLCVKLNDAGDGRLTISAPDEAIEIHVLRGRDLPEAQRALIELLGGMQSAPSSALLGDAFFCTWTQFPRCITQQRILDFARKIREYDYPCSTLIIDDRWESCFGELTFAAKDFPDPRAMVRELAELGIAVWLWVTPFVNQEAATFAELSAKGILVPNTDGNGAALFRWWGGTAGLVDVTNPDGRAWFRERLRYLKEEIGVAGFKIDGGDFKYQPTPEIAAWHDPQGPSGYSDALLAIFEELAPHHCETRTAWLSQSRSILWREGGKDSHWGLDNGLKAMVTLAMHLALMGYDMIMPDMIPGRVQTMVSDMPLPSDELMVRWTEATAVMPYMQFSYAPWNYAKDTERAVHGYACLHKALEGYLVTHAETRTTPLLRPLWYDYPQQDTLYTVADEFFLGPDLIVAPVLDEGATTRRIILPHGEWRDAWTGATLAAGEFAEYPAPCPGMPIFVRAEACELFDTVHAALQQITRGSVPNGQTTATYCAGLDRDLSVTG